MKKIIVIAMFLCVLSANCFAAFSYTYAEVGCSSQTSDVTTIGLNGSIDVLPFMTIFGGIFSGSSRNISNISGTTIGVGLHATILPMVDVYGEYSSSSVEQTYSYNGYFFRKSTAQTVTQVDGGFRIAIAPSLELDLMIGTVKPVNETIYGAALIGHINSMLSLGMSHSASGENSATSLFLRVR